MSTWRSHAGSVAADLRAQLEGTRTQLEDALVQLRDALALVEHAPDAIVILDVDAGRFVQANAAAEELFGVLRNELLRMGPVEVSPPTQPDGRSSETAAGEYIQRALDGARPRFEWVHRRADGGAVPCEVTLMRLPSPGRRLVRGSLLDITERRQAETARRDAAAAQAARRAAEGSAARLRAMVAGLNAIVWEREPLTGRSWFVNARAEEVLGYPAGSWLAEASLWERILHPADREEVLDRIRRALAEDGDVALSYRVRAADGRWVWLHHLEHIARDEADRPTAMHSVLIDVTEQRRREQAAALLAEAGRVLAGPGTVSERLTAVTGLLVGDLCDWAAVWLRGDDERYRAVAAAPADVAGPVRTLGSLRVPEEFEPQLRSGQAFAVPEASDEVLRAATSTEDQLAVLEGLGSRCWLAAPLITGGTLAGLLTLTSGQAARYDDGDVALAEDLGWRIASMVAAERQTTQRRMLHEITVALSAAGTVAEAASALTSGLRTVLGASVVAVCTLGGEGLLHPVDIVGYPAERLARFARMRLDAGLPLTEAALTRRPVWLADRAAVVERFPAVAGSLLPHTEGVAALPLLVGNRLLGALGVTFTTARPFDAEERALLLTIAGQAALAFERAALADVRREMAETLQRSLLPGELPQVERLAVTARYLPAVSGTQAGGDWYDVLPLADGRVALAVGDVVGHGAAAAAVMGQLRSALAGLLLAGHPPAEALRLLDTYSEHIAGARVASVACLLLDPTTGSLVHSCAGHPPPLLVEPGEATPRGMFLDGGSGPVLGLPNPGPRRDAATTVRPGATLLLYTDGLVERRRASLDDGLARLAGAVTARTAAPLPALVDGVLRDLLEREGAEDDIALVALRLLPAPLRLDLPAEPAQLQGLRRAVARWATAAGFDGATVEDLQLALGEAAGNAVEHAYRSAAVPGRVSVELTADGDGGVTIAVGDGGSWRPVPGDPGFRGRGLQIISALAGDVQLDAGNAGTVLRFRIPGPLLAATAGAPSSRVEPRPGEQPATLVVTDAAGHHCVELTGDLDLAGVATVRDTLLAELSADRPVTLDLTRLGFVASVGVGLLLEAAQTAGGIDVLVPATGPVRRLLDLTGLTTVLPAARTDLPG